MSAIPAPTPPGNRPVNLPIVLVSVGFHVFVLLVIPLAMKLTYRPKKLARPHTFQLVSAPEPPQPTRQVAKKAAQSKPKPAPKPSPTEQPSTRSKPQETSTPSENTETAEEVEELASLLEALPSPATVTALGDFKYNWYLMSVQQKIERNWRPPTENDNLSVTVAFTIFASGEVSDVRVAKPSGNQSIDNLAERAVSVAAPFGKLPPGFDDNKLEIRCELIPVRR
jgi:TonB family protein